MFWDCLERLAVLELPGWYLGAGCIAQTVWNAAHGKAPGSDIHHGAVTTIPASSNRSKWATL